MIKRIVKLTFKQDKSGDFLQIFNENKHVIRQSPGCQYLELLRHAEQPNVFFTLSFWDSQADLDDYRHSDFFQNTWLHTKKLFAAKPEAWSLESYFIENL